MYMKKLIISIITFALLILFIPLTYARGQSASRTRAPQTPPPPAQTAPPSPTRIDPSEPIRGAPVTTIADDEDNRVTADGQVIVVPVRSGTVDAAGWVYPDNHASGMGYRVQVDTGDGYHDSYGHLTPDSAPAVGTAIVASETIIGTMADPTNGHSTGPHVHVERRDSENVAVDPGPASPFLGDSIITSGFGQVDAGLRSGTSHSGVDHIPAW